MYRFRSPATLLALVALGGLSRAGAAQSLRGSIASVDRMYDQAVHDGLTFYETTNAVHWAAARGELVQLHTDHGYALRRVAFPYVRPATLTFVERLADDYERVCDEPLVVTSGVRPESRQPSNSSHRSVHPTGMAVDLHKPTNGRCLTWLRRELLALEGTGVIEATEEHHPAHFHVAVFADDYMRFARIQSEANPTVMIVARTSPPSPVKQPSKRYRVREGDSLWSIAQQHSTSVAALIAANRMGSETKIKTGQTLVIPAR